MRRSKTTTRTSHAGEHAVTSRGGLATMLSVKEFESIIKSAQKRQPFEVRFCAHKSSLTAVNSAEVSR